jgi:hypothetical protein
MTKLQNTKNSDHNKIDRNDLVMRYGLALSTFQLIPGLVGLWPFSSLTYPGAAVVSLDHSHNILHLTQGGNAFINLRNQIVPVMECTGATTDLFYSADDDKLDIVGNETVFDSSMNGLTVGGWFKSDESRNSPLVFKTGTANHVSNFPYGLLQATGSLASFQVRNSAGTTNYSASVDLVIGAWNFVVGRYTPGSEVKVWVDDTYEVNTTSIPATLFTSNGEFRVGGQTTQNFDGQSAFVFLAATAISDTLRSILYQQTYVLFK